MRTRNMMTPILAAALGLTIAFAAPAAYGWSQTALAAERSSSRSQSVCPPEVAFTQRHLR